MDIKSLQDNWDRFGQTDPLWAILVDPSKRGGRWNPEEFFESGRVEIAEAMAYLKSLPVTAGRGQALDFGCGVGRLTQALCDYFDECHGVDIAPSMLELARKFNRFGSKAVYHLNDRPDLALFKDSSFDFIYSRIVLQHMRPSYHLAYIREFVRLLKPGGVAMFQLPVEAVDSHAMAKSAFRASIAIGPLPRTLRAGADFEISVRVRNVGKEAWCGDRDRIRLGNHWFDDHDGIVVNDDGRSPLPHDVQPGEEVVMPLKIRVPAAEGRYILECDMVQEGVTWFRTQGSPTARTRVWVTRGHPELAWIRRGWDRLRSPRPRPAEPVMEVYGTPKEQVIAQVRDAGGQVLDTREDESARPKWTSCIYCVTKAACP